MKRRDFHGIIATMAGALMSGCGGDTDVAPIYPRTEAERASGVEPVNLDHPPGSWVRYGADPSGVGDSTRAIATAAAVALLGGARAFDDVGGTYRVTGPVVVGSGVTVSGLARRTELQCANADESVFVAIDAHGVVIESILFRVTAISTKPYTAPVVFQHSAQCVCRDCEFVGCNWAGVWLLDSSFCVVSGCHFHDFQGTVQDSADVCVYNNSSDNVVVDNRCFGGNDHGVLIENPYNQAFPARNLVARNHIAGNRAYGVCVYLPDEGNTYNRIADNRIENIRGTSFEGASGPGVYVAGAGAGGTSITGNTLLRCCLQTSSRTESPGAIGVHGMTAGNAPLTISRNLIDETARYDGILVAVSAAPVAVTENIVRFLAGNTEGTPIRVEEASHVVVSGNTLTRPPSDGGCIFVYALGTTSSDITVSSNDCSGGAYTQIRFAGEAHGRIEGVVCSGNHCHDAADKAAAMAMGLVSVTNAVITANRCSANAAVALYLRDAVKTRVGENILNSTGAVSVLAEGYCAESVYLASNAQSGAIDNQAIGLQIGGP